MSGGLKLVSAGLFPARPLLARRTVNLMSSVVFGFAPWYLALGKACKE